MRDLSAKITSSKILKRKKPTFVNEKKNERKLAKVKAEGSKSLHSLFMPDLSHFADS